MWWRIGWRELGLRLVDVSRYLFGCRWRKQKGAPRLGHKGRNTRHDPGSGSNGKYTVMIIDMVKKEEGRKESSGIEAIKYSNIAAAHAQRKSIDACLVSERCLASTHRH